MVLAVAHWSIMFRDEEINMESGMLWGYLNMIIALSMVFFGVRQYRDRHLGGSITFGKAFMVGFLIALIASAAYIIAWMIFYETSEAARAVPTQYVETMKENWIREGITGEELDKKVAKMSSSMETYANNAVVRVGMTLLEILPVMLLVPLISALILRRKIVRS